MPAINRQVLSPSMTSAKVNKNPKLATAKKQFLGEARAASAALWLEAQRRAKREGSQGAVPPLEKEAASAADWLRVRE
jgi:hypothetical protein